LRLLEVERLGFTTSQCSRLILVIQRKGHPLSGQFEKLVAQVGIIGRSRQADAFSRGLVRDVA
jgi:hypothetical protein